MAVNQQEVEKALDKASDKFKDIIELISKHYDIEIGYDIKFAWQPNNKEVGSDGSKE